MADGMRWVAAKRVERGGQARGVYEQHPESPEFDDVGKLMRWLERRGLIEKETEGFDGGYRGWGNPWYAIPVGSRALVRHLHAVEESDAASR